MLASGLPDVVQDAEDLPRFIYSSSHFNASGPKPAAYLPSADNETSVFRHGAEPTESLWGLNIRTCTLYGAAIVRTAVVREVGLDVTPDEPPQRHAVIKGWPPANNDPDLQKAKQKEFALAIASKAILMKRS
jgi:hypothetical protein